MLNLGGIFGAIGRMLPGYIQGREQAIASNWNDLNQYNQVQAGQINNAFGELTFPLRYNIAADEAAVSRAGMFNELMNLDVRKANMPYELGTAAIRSRYGLVPYARRTLQAATGTNVGTGNGGTQQNTGSFTADFNRQLQEANAQLQALGLPPLTLGQQNQQTQTQPANESLMRQQNPTVTQQ